MKRIYYLISSIALLITAVLKLSRYSPFRGERNLGGCIMNNAQFVLLALVAAVLALATAHATPHVLSTSSDAIDEADSWRPPARGRYSGANQKSINDQREESHV